MGAFTWIDARSNRCREAARRAWILCKKSSACRIAERDWGPEARGTTCSPSITPTRGVESESVVNLIRRMLGPSHLVGISRACPEMRARGSANKVERVQWQDNGSGPVLSSHHFPEHGRGQTATRPAFFELS